MRGGVGWCKVVGCGVVGIVWRSGVVGVVGVAGGRRVWEGWDCAR